MNTTRHIEQDDLALYAMQLLSTEETANITGHVKECQECRQELAALQSDLAIYAHTVELHSPPAVSRERLMKQVAREKKIVPIARPSTAESVVDSTTRPGSRSESRSDLHAEPLLRPEPSFSSSRSSYLDDEDLPQRSFGSKVLPWAGWAIAAGLAVAATSFYQQRNELRNTVAADRGQLAQLTAEAASARQLLDTLNDSTALRVTLQKPQTAPVPQARATYVADKGSLLFTASNMEPLQAYKVYELWIIPADGRDPVAAGTFHPDGRGNASVILPTLPKGIEAKAFGVTIEDEGGSQTPTMPIIMAGSAA